MQSGQTEHILPATSMRQTVSVPQSAHALAEGSTWELLIPIDLGSGLPYRKLSRGGLAAGVFQ